MRWASAFVAVVVFASATSGTAVVAGSGEHDHDGAAAAGAPDEVVRGPQGDVGQFVVECGFSHAATADPILHPGVAEAGHLHQFFGSSVTAADATYADLVSAPTSCQHRSDTAAYWAPALLADGEPVTPWRAVAYYRAGPGVDPTTVEPYPPGLKLLAGEAGATSSQPESVVGWTCNGGTDRRARPPSCPEGATLRLIVTFPDCWDGRRTDSADHRAHAAYSAGGACPPDQRVPIPQLQLAIDYPAHDPATLSLSSGDVLGAHADFWNTWDQDALTREVTACLHRDVVCGVSG